MSAISEAALVPPSILGDLFCPPDVETSRERFKTSCGHAAIAALLRCSVADVWHVQPKPYTSPSAAEKALQALGAAPKKLWPREKGRAAPWPTTRGLVVVQIAGPWLDPGVPIGAAYKRMHCVAVEKDASGNWWVFDHNVDGEDIGAPWQGVVGPEGGGWLLGGLWKDQIMRAIVADTKKATGWWARASFEVSEPSRRPS